MLLLFCALGAKKRLAHQAPAVGKGAFPLFYMEIQPKALATELARMIAAKMGHR